MPQEHTEDSGINVGSNAEYAVATAVGIGILHFVLAPLLAILGIVLLLMLGVCEIPCIIVALATHHAHSAVPAMAVLGTIGAIVWLWWAWRVCKKIWHGFGKHTKMNYVKGYEGPLPNLGRHPASTDASSPQTQPRSTHT